MLKGRGDNYGGGFTIVELLVVIVVVGILASITIVSYAGISSSAIVASLKSDLSNAAKLLKLDQIQSDTGSYPLDISAANGGNGIVASPGTILEYSVNNDSSPQTFCITATNNSITYKVTDDNASPEEGNCLRYGLVGEWLFNGDTSDTSGNSNIGYLQGVTDYNIADRSNVFGRAMAYNSGRMYVNESESLRLQRLTISAWVYNPNTSLSKTIINKRHAASGVGYRAYNIGFSSSSGYGFSINNSTSAVGVNSSYLGSQGVWHFVVATYDGMDMEIFVDGLLRNQNNIGSVVIDYYIPQSLYFGDFDGGGYDNPISVDDVRIYNRSLSDSEIQLLYNLSPL
jgi:prepilin-type N-terminal cleavage/methylation domain-containing protein